MWAHPPGTHFCFFFSRSLSFSSLSGLSARALSARALSALNAHALSLSLCARLICMLSPMPIMPPPPVSYLWSLRNRAVLVLVQYAVAHANLETVAHANLAAAARAHPHKRLPTPSLSKQHTSSTLPQVPATALRKKNTACHRGKRFVTLT